MDEPKRISATKAIRLKCLDCCCGNPNEVRLCTIPNCPLYPFRFGKDPYRKPRSEAQREIARQNMSRLWDKKNGTIESEPATP